MRPTTLHVGGTLYWELRTRDPDTMLLKDADATPTVAVRRNGVSVGDSVTINKRSATTGIYDCSYNPASEVEGETISFEERVQVTGTSTAQAYYDSGFVVRVTAVERGTDSAALASGVNVTQLGGDTQSLTDLKDFADAGYDPSTNKVAGVVLVDTLTTYTGNTPQTGDSYAIVNNGTHGSSALKAILDIIAADTTTDIPSLIATLQAFVDTEVSAIKAKTDNLPDDPADQSAVEAAITTATSTLATASSLATVAGYIDTEITAIKAKTDNLPSDPADASDIASSFSTVNSTLATISGYLDTEIAAIKTKTDNLPASFPANFSNLGINASGHISRVVLVDTTTTNSDLISAATIASTIFTTQMTESYSADGVAPTLAQALFLIQQAFTEFVITGTGISVKKLDGVTEAASYTMDSATSPTQRIRTS